MYESQKHYAKWKKPYTKDYMLYDSIYLKFSVADTQNNDCRGGEQGSEG